MDMTLQLLDVEMDLIILLEELQYIWWIFKTMHGFTFCKIADNTADDLVLVIHLVV